MTEPHRNPSSTPPPVLKPCPFCGKQPRTCADDSYGAARVWCPDDNECWGHPEAWAILTKGETLEMAIDRWNLRLSVGTAARSNQEATPELVEQFARAMFDEWPMHAVSQALADQSGQKVGSALTYDKVVEMGGNHDGLLRLAKGAVKLHERLKPVQEATRTVGDAVSIVRNILYRRTPTDVDANLLREIADEIIVALSHTSSSGGI
jgi:hypothetical protein